LFEESLSSDVVQEAFLRLWRRRDSVDMSTVEPLLYKTAINLASNRRRTKKLWRWLSLESLRNHDGKDPNGEQALERKQGEQAVQKAVDELPEGLKRIVMLCEYSELTHQQIGKLLGIPPGTVGSRRHQALGKLRQSLAGTTPIDNS
jgi:RNA polymerase sigma factor (sigma-70 family)